MKDYIDKHSDSPSEDIIMKLILDFHRKERNVLLPTRAGFNQLVDTLCYDYNIFPVEMLCAKMRYIS
jgi:hypothetical protein